MTQAQLPSGNLNYPTASLTVNTLTNGGGYRTFFTGSFISSPLSTTGVITSTSGGDIALSVKNSVLISTGDGTTYDLVNMLKLLEVIAEKMSVILPQLESHAEYPALKSAYDAYCVMSKLCDNSD